MFTLTFETDNAAFEAGPNEIVRILRDVAMRAGAGETEGNIRDINGKTVGSFKLTD